MKRSMAQVHCQEVIFRPGGGLAGKRLSEKGATVTTKVFTIWPSAVTKDVVDSVDFTEFVTNRRRLARPKLARA
jgi:hypothetical protein